MQFGGILFFVGFITHVSVAGDIFQDSAFVQEASFYQTDSARVYRLMAEGKELLSDDKDLALTKAQEALSISRTLGDSLIIADAQVMLAYVFMIRRNFPAALEQYIASYDVIMASEDVRRMSDILMELGYLEYVQQNHEQVIQYMEQVIPLAEASGDYQIVGESSFFLGKAYGHLGDTTGAIRVYKQALEKVRGKNAFGEASLYGALGAHLWEYQHDPEALVYLKKALRFYSSIPKQDDIAIGSLKRRMADIWIDQHIHLDSARSYLHEALELFRKHRFADLELELQTQLARLDSTEGHLHCAITHWQRYAVLSDSIHKAAKLEQYESMRAAFEAEKREQENQQLTALNEQQAEQLTRNRQYNLLVIMLLLIVAGFALGLMYLYQRLRRNHQFRVEQSQILLKQTQELEEAKQEVDHININLELMVQESTAKLKGRNEQLQEYAYMNAHKVRGPLARLLGLITILQDPKLHSRNEADLLLEQVYRSAEELDEVIKGINDNLQTHEVIVGQGKDESSTPPLIPV
ncbi:MAG TPA: hypothetical protein DCE41_35625 [Cytophagales bacterium]|nr:hypothetical protein [Cytophagales bacterium]HAA21095.1 hypothetical protein [Cytophagales bacterium]HAP65163.1 hypothetical protein [Cytophagales bacterium]